MKIRTRQRYSFVLIMAAILLTLMSMTPFVDVEGGSYRILTFVIMAILSIVLLMVFNFKAVFSDRYLKSVFFFLIWAVVQTIVLQTGGLRVRMTDMTAVVYVFFFVCIGYCVPFSEEYWEWIAGIFSVATAMLGLYTVYYYLGSMSFAMDMYAVGSKNQIGQVVAVGCTSAMMLFARSRGKTRFFFLVIMVVGVATLFLLRCRTASLAFLFCFFLYFYRRIKGVWLVVAILLLVLAVALFSNSILEFMSDAFVGNKDIEDLDSMSTGRLERNVQGLQWWSDHILLGELRGASGVPPIHNYLINRLIANGIFAFPYYVIYFIFCGSVFEGWKQSAGKVVSGGVMATIPFVASLAELSAPFGPGMVQMTVFLFVGMDLRLRRKQV